MVYEYFRRGINLGGWLSQYEFIARQPLTDEHLSQHFETFIQEKDLRQIASWGFDHVRLPISGYLLYDVEQDRLDDRALQYVRRCIDWCRSCQLNIVLDLHDIYGNVYGAMEEPMPLLTEEVLQNRFVRVWELMAREFQNVTDIKVMFELLNEVSDASGAYPFTDVAGRQYDLSHAGDFLWNQLYRKCIARIRSIDADRWILVGSNGQNSVVYLKELDIVDDPHVFYNFHYYDPQVFTHQRAGFSEEMSEFDREVHYPDDISGFVTYLNAHPDWKRKHALVAEETSNDRDLMERLLQHAADFIRETGRELYCGEFGVMAHAPAEAAKGWVKDLTAIFDRNHIGCALWNYKYLDFGLLDLDGAPCSSLI